MDSFPTLALDLLEALDEHYSPIQPADVIALSDKELAFLAGQRSVVEFLKMVKERTDEEEDPFHDV